MRQLTGIIVTLLLALAAPAAAQVVAAQPWTSLRQTAPLPPVTESGRIDVGDVELYYAIYGKGRPVVLLHPGLGNADYWANQVGPLSQDYQVVVVDTRGHGRSTGSDRPLSYRLLADDILTVIRKLNLKKPAIVGWGDGAVVGLELARRHPGRVGKLVVFGLVWDVSGQQPNVDKAPTFVSYVHKTAADYAAMSPQPDRFDRTFRQLEALWLAEPRYTAEQLGDIKVSTVVMAAAHDEWAQLDHMQQAAVLIPHAQLMVLPEVSHFAPWQAPKLFNDGLRLMLR